MSFIPSFSRLSRYIWLFPFTKSTFCLFKFLLIFFRGKSHWIVEVPHFGCLFLHSVIRLVPLPHAFPVYWHLTFGDRVRVDSPSESMSQMMLISGDTMSGPLTNNTAVLISGFRGWRPNLSVAKVCFPFAISTTSKRWFYITVGISYFSTTFWFFARLSVISLGFLFICIYRF